MGIVERVKKLLEREQPLKQGIYHYRSPAGQEERFRLHLRVEPGGDGVLVINASKVLHLNRTATEYAKLLVEDKDPDEAARHVSHRYRVSRSQARSDYETLRDTILTCTRGEDICPITYLDVNRIEPFQTPVSAPYRMDLAITYRCNADCPHCYVGRDRDFPEMPTEKWQEVLRRLWSIGIPHVTFTGGDPTMREDLRELIAYGEEIGMVTGLLTNGRKLADKEYLAGLVAAGLDHTQITIESHDEAIHNRMVGCEGWAETVAGISNCVAADMYLMTNTTLTSENIPTIEDTIDFVASLGVQNVACNSLIYSGKGKQVGTGLTEKDLVPVLERVKAAAKRNDVRLVWYTPTQYCEFDPVKQELGLKTCTAAMYNMAIEPNGDVIPCQSYYTAMGNILTDSWDSIWNSDLAQGLRNRTWVQDKCKTCDDLNLCGGGCPLYAAEQPVRCVESQSTSQ